MGGAASHHENELVLDVLRLDEPAFAVNGTHQIVAWNNGAERLLGLQADQMIGRRCYEALAVSDAALCAACRYLTGAVARGEAPAEAVESMESGSAPRSMTLSAPASPASDAASDAARRVHVTTIAAHTLEGQVRFVHLLRPAPAEPVEAEVAPRPPAHERLPTPDPGAYAPVAEAAESSARQRRPALLTQRELEVLRLLGAGHSTDDISRELNITRVTARNHVNKVLDKLGVNSRLQAVVIASQLQLI